MIGLDDFFPDHHRPFQRHLFAQVTGDQGEFIASQTIERFRGFTEKRQAAGQFLQQFIAGIVAQRIVYIFKIIEVEKHHHGTAIVRPDLIDNFLQLLPEGEPVRHPGQRVMVGIVLQTAVLHLQFLF